MPARLLLLMLLLPTEIELLLLPVKLLLLPSLLQLPLPSLLLLSLVPAPLLLLSLVRPRISPISPKPRSLSLTGTPLLLPLLLGETPVPHAEI